MKSKLSVALAAAIFVAGIAIATPSKAQTSGIYANLQGGTVVIPDAKSKGALLQVESEFDLGFLFTAALGYKFENNLRLEGEFGYSESGINQIKVTNAGGTGVATGSPRAATAARHGPLMAPL